MRAALKTILTMGLIGGSIAAGPTDQRFEFVQAIVPPAEVRERLRNEVGDEVLKWVKVKATMHSGADVRFMVVVSDDPDSVGESAKVVEIPAKGCRVSVVASPSIEIHPGQLYRAIATIRIETASKVMTADVEVSGVPIVGSLNEFGQERFAVTTIWGFVKKFYPTTRQSDVNVK